MLQVKVDGEFQPVGGGEPMIEYGNNLTLGIPSSVSKMTFPEGAVGDLGNNAFYGYTSLTELTLPSSMTGTIGDSAFYGCSSLTELTLPSSMTGSIGTNAFRGCISLTELTLPSSMTGFIGSSAFRECTSLTELTLPSSMTGTLEGYAFYNCSSLTKLVILNESGINGLSSTNVFSNCPALIYVPDALVDNYKVATVWSALADRIFGHSEIPA